MAVVADHVTAFWLAGSAHFEPIRALLGPMEPNLGPYGPFEHPWAHLGPMVLSAGTKYLVPWYLVPSSKY